MLASQKRSATSPLQNSNKKPVDFSKLRLGVDYFQVQQDGAVQNVLIKDCLRDLPLQGIVPESPLKGVNTPSKSSTPGRSSYYRSPSSKENSQGNPITLQSLQQSMNQKFMQLDTKLNSEKSGILPSITKITRIVNDSVYGLDAINLRLDALETDGTHPSGFRTKFAEIAQEIDNMHKDQIQIQLDSSESDVFVNRLSELNKKDTFLESKMDLMAHTIQSQQQDIHSLKLSIASLVVVNLSCNLFIGGIREKPLEDCKTTCS